MKKNRTEQQPQPHEEIWYDLEGNEVRLSVIDGPDILAAEDRDPYSGSDEEDEGYPGDEEDEEGRPDDEEGDAPDGNELTLEEIFGQVPEDRYVPVTFQMLNSLGCFEKREDGLYILAEAARLLED